VKTSVRVGLIGSKFVSSIHAVSVGASSRDLRDRVQSQRSLLHRILLVAWVAAAPVVASSQPTSTDCTPEDPKLEAERDKLTWMPFPQEQRVLAPPEVLERGKGIFSVNCAACHGADLRGGARGGPNLLRSAVAMSDQHGEAILPIVRGARQDRGMPAFTLPDTDVVAVAEYIHSVLAQSVGAQGAPSSSEVPLRVIVGNPRAGRSDFAAKCAGCHSVTQDLKGIGAKYPEPRTLQNSWVAGSDASSRSRPGCHSAQPTVVVTLANGDKLNGTLLQDNDFIVTLVKEDGTRRSITRNADVVSVEIHDPNEAHRKLALSLDDRIMHDITAYLVTLK
jgi:cytochrome c oxidase cbb3-type subunit III